MLDEKAIWKGDQQGCGQCQAMSLQWGGGIVAIQRRAQPTTLPQGNALRCMTLPCFTAEGQPRPARPAGRLRNCQPGFPSTRTPTRAPSRSAVPLPRAATCLVNCDAWWQKPGPRPGPCVTGVNSVKAPLVCSRQLGVELMNQL